MKKLKLKKVTLKDLDQKFIGGLAAEPPQATELNSCLGRHTCPGGGCTMVGLRCVGEIDR